MTSPRTGKRDRARRSAADAAIEAPSAAGQATGQAADPAAESEPDPRYDVIDYRGRVIKGPGEKRSIGERLAIKQKQAHALELKKQGASYQEIADAIGYRGRQGAFEAVKIALAEVTREPAEELLALELERCERMFLGLVANGAFSGDPKAVLAAVRVLELRARYLGLIRQDVVVQPPVVVNVSAQAARAFDPQLLEAGPSDDKASGPTH